MDQHVKNVMLGKKHIGNNKNLKAGNIPHSVRKLWMCSLGTVEGWKVVQGWSYRKNDQIWEIFHPSYLGDTNVWGR